MQYYLFWGEWGWVGREMVKNLKKVYLLVNFNCEYK